MKGMQLFIELKFQIKKTLPKSDLKEKMLTLGFEGEAERIIVSFAPLDNAEKEIVTVNAIFDTDAPISLLPKSLFSNLENFTLIPHTVHGIVDSEECEIKCLLTKMQIVIKDRNGNKSPPVNILIGLSEKENVPYILGMKGILSTEIIGKFEGKFFYLDFK